MRSLTTRSKSHTVILHLILSSIPAALCHPQPPGWLSARQTSFADLALPKCALSCFINSLTSDGCTNETDFKCHCEKGNVQVAAGPCLRRGCEEDDRTEALGRVEAACREAGIDLGGGDRGSNTRTPAQISPSTTSTGESGASSQPSSSNVNSTPSTSSSPSSSPSSPGSTPAPAPSPDSSQPIPSSTPTSDSNPPPPPTDTPLALLPPDRQLSTAAKAGIGLSVSLLFTSILLITALYIRRLKRDLAAAQAAASSIWEQAQSTTHPAPLPRHPSWRNKEKANRGRSPPLSPVSPMRESPHSPRSSSSSSLSAVLLKKKRGPILSVVVEAEEASMTGSRAGSESASTYRFIREPVVGQMEGLTDPLELDGVERVVWELSGVVTPRGRSLERSSEGVESENGHGREKSRAGSSRSRSAGERKTRFGI